jgi:sugar lactone lactonase YvrE
VAGASGYACSHITTDGTSLYVADFFNHTIRQVVIATGKVTTLAGSGNPNDWGCVDDTGVDARFYKPLGITTDGTNVYVADTGNNTIRQVVIATGEVTTLAGSGDPNDLGCIDDTGVNARFYNPFGITTDGTSLFVADSGNNKIREIN